MGLLESMLGLGASGEPGVCKFSSDRYDVTYTVSAESHEIAYAIPVHASELDALAALLAAEDEHPLLSDDDAVSETVDAALADEGIDAAAVTDRIRRPRRIAEDVLETWRELVDEDVGVAYLPVGLEGELAAFVAICRERAEREDDPFALPADFESVAALLVRIRRASERAESRVVANRRRLPGVERR